MANPWFKFHAGDYLADLKIMQLDAQERSCWVTLLCLANQGDGTIKFLTEQRLLILSGVVGLLPGILDKFESLGLVTQRNGNVTVSNWEKRQYSEGYLRQKNFRKRRRNANDNDRTEQNRTEQIRREETLPVWLNKNAWEAWKKYRKEIGKTLKPSTTKMQLRFLEANQKNHTQIIKNSITNGWTGLFIIKENDSRPKESRTRHDESEERHERKISAEDNQRRIDLVRQMTVKP